MTLLRRYFDWKAENEWIWSVERVRSIMIRLSEEHSINVSAKHGTSNTTPHPIGNAPALGLVWDRIPHLLLVLILGSEYGNISMVKTYMRAYSLNGLWHSGIYEHLGQVLPCGLSRNWVSSTNNACIIPRNPITMRCSWSEFVPTSAHIRKSGISADAVSVRRRRLAREWGFPGANNLICVSACFLHEHVRPHEYAFSTLIAEVAIFFKEVMLKPSLWISSTINIQTLQCPLTRIEKKDTHCFGNTLYNFPAYPPLLLHDQL